MNPIQIINLLNVPRIGPHRLKKILAPKQDQNPFEASIKDLRAIKGIDAKAAEQIRSYRDLDFGTREFPLGTQPDRGKFPRRNRIISGHSHATVVADAGKRSGVILTALNAVDQNRDGSMIPKVWAPTV